MAKDPCCKDNCISAECVSSITRLRELCGFAACVGSPVRAHADWPVDKPSGLDKWCYVRASKVECLRAGAQVCTHESPQHLWRAAGAGNFAKDPSSWAEPGVPSPRHWGLIWLAFPAGRVAHQINCGNVASYCLPAGASTFLKFLMLL